MRKGFLLVISIMIAAVVLTVGLGVASITYKEIIISSFSKESQKAFYAADSGIECALYWDLRWGGNESAFATSTIISSRAIDVPKCNNQNLPLENPVGSGTYSTWPTSSDSNTAKTEFNFSLSNGEVGEPYVEVIVEKEVQDPNANPLVITTKITARGYNFKDSTNPRRVNRSIQKTY